MKRRGETGMSVIVRNTACVLLIPITVFGLFIILHGHLSPGGGFAGGAVTATVIAMFLVAFGRDSTEKMPRRRVLTELESLALVLFALMAFLGLGATLFKNFLADSVFPFGMTVPFGPNPGYLGTGGVIPLMNMYVGMEVFAALSLVVLVMYTGLKED
jgi:multisubunit Na+/H+ antiporter MnhB subunit